MATTKALDEDGVVLLASDIKTLSDATYPSNAAIASAYDATATYSVGDYCLRNGLLYKCNTAIGSGGEAWDSTHWTLTNIVSNFGASADILYVGASAPSSPDVQIWLDTDEPGMSAVSSVNGATGTVVLDADDVGAMSKWELLWENASPSSAFSAQTISLDLSQYKWILVSLRHWVDNTARTIWIVENNNTIHVCAAPSHTFSANPARNITANDTGVTFSAGYNAQNATEMGAIPVTIHGIKGVATA